MKTWIKFLSVGLNSINLGGREKMSTSNFIDVVKSQKMGYMKKHNASAIKMYLTIKKRGLLVAICVSFLFYCLTNSVLVSSRIKYIIIRVARMIATTESAAA